MKFTYKKNVDIAGENAYLVMTTEMRDSILTTVVHKNEFANKLGGTRFVKTGSIEEAYYLARGMSDKCLACSIPLDGLKTLVVSPGGTLSDGEKAFLLSTHILNCNEIQDGLIFGPDMGSPETVMDKTLELLHWSYDNITGLSKKFGGLDIDKNGFTAYGVKASMNFLSSRVDGFRVAIQGYGEVGSALANLLFHQKYKIIAASNVNGVLMDPGGIDIDHLNSHIHNNAEKCLLKYKAGDQFKYSHDPQILFDIETDILIPAARTSVLALEKERNSLVSENPDVLSIEQVIKKLALKLLWKLPTIP